MNRLIIFLTLALLILSQIVHAQKPAESVFFANRGGERQWLSYQDNHRALYRIITNEAFRQLEERAEKVSKFQSAEDWKNIKTKSKQLCAVRW
jgi:hypothetical protein